MDIIRAPNIEDMKDVYPLKTRREIQPSHLAIFLLFLVSVIREFLD